jgi:two-component sensor histidine kinase
VTRVSSGGAAQYLQPASEVERLLTHEVEDLKTIHGLSLRLASADTLANILADTLTTAAGLVDAKLGSVQLVTPDGKLEMMGQVGFGDVIFDQFGTLSLEDCSTCAVALQRRSRVIVPDLQTDPDFAGIAAALQSYGAASAVSTPVKNQAGKVLAMFSVYWTEKRDPDERDLRTLDLCAELAGRHVERSVSANELRDVNQRRVLLMRELAHRGKNLLAVIQSIAARSLRGERSLDEARDVFIGRLGALASTYNTFTEEYPESVHLRDIVSAGLEAYGERTVIEGPKILIPAKQAQTLALVIHELATNAAKYGALSSVNGRVDVSWKIFQADGHANFSLTWSESGGPPVKAGAKKGFGSVIITSLIATELNCSPTVEFRPSGIEYRLECLFSALSADTAHGRPR